MQSLEAGTTLIALDIVVLGVPVALIGYPLLILIALIATLTAFVLMVLVSIDDIGGIGEAQDRVAWATRAAGG